MEGVGLLFGKFSAMFADDKDQGRMTLSECCFSVSSNKRMLFKLHGAQQHTEGRKDKGSDPGFKYLPVRNVLAGKLLINLVQKMKNGEIKKTSTQRDLSTYFRQPPLCALLFPSTPESYLLSLMGWPDLPPANPLNARFQRKAIIDLKLQITDQGQKPCQLPILKGRYMEQKRWESNRRSSGPGGRGGSHLVILC